MLKLVNPEYPIWEVTEFEVPNFNYILSNPRNYTQPGHDNSSGLRQSIKIPQEVNLAWHKSCLPIQEMLKTCDELVVEQMWKGKLKSFEWPDSEYDSVDVLLDKPGFNMPAHIDSRIVLGVLIINLQDNPENSGTYYEQLDYRAPTQKGTGTFMLNHINTLHSINQPGPTDRLIGYQPLTIHHIPIV
jgi:hypothetical protein